MRSYLQSLSYFFRLPLHIQWRTFLVQIPRFVPLSILHLTSPKGPHPFIIALPSRKGAVIPIYVFIPPKPVHLDSDDEYIQEGEWKVPVVLDFHGGGFIMGSPLEQAPYCSMMSRELGAVVISVSYRIGPFHQFPAAVHDGEDVLSAILDTDGISKASQILRTGIQRSFTMMRNASRKNPRKWAHLHGKTTITLDPSRLSISGFSAGGNLALNMALSVPANCPGAAPSRTFSPSGNNIMSPLLPPNRAQTILDDPCQAWSSLLPPPQAQPRLMPLLLFYPSLDARLLPHERPSKILPNALTQDETPQKPKVPGLFSIMGPTYLPKKLRAHPRASPGLSDPTKDIQKNAAIFLVLPEKDTLAVQSDVWVDKMNGAGWTGPVRFGDERDADMAEVAEGVSRKSRWDLNGGLEVWHSPECVHGWTQFPEPVLGKHQRKERDLVFARTLDFVKEQWKRKLPSAPVGDSSADLAHAQTTDSIPSLSIRS